MTRSSLLLTILMFLSYVLYPQDSGQSKAKETQLTQALDSVQVNIWNDKAYDLRTTKPDSSIFFAEKAKDLAEKLNFEKGYGIALKNKGLALYNKTDYSQALDLWQEALTIFENNNLKLNTSNVLNNIGSVYQMKGVDTKAIDYFFKSLKIAEELGDKKQIASCYINVGAVYANDRKTYSQSLETFDKAIKLAEEIGEYGLIGFAEFNIGEISLNLRQLERATDHFNKAKDAFEKINYTVYYYAALGKLAKIALESGNLNEAEKDLYEIIRFFEANDSKQELAQTYITLGDVNYQEKKFESAVNNYTIALKLADSINTFREMQDAYKGLANTYATQGNYSNAYEFQQLFAAIKDSIKDDQYEKTIGRLRFEYDLDSKEKQISLLNTQNELNKAQIEKEATARKLLIAILILLVFIIGGFIFQYRYVKRSHKRLDREKKRSERILLNILPKETAEELKNNGFIKAKRFESVTVLFTDFKAFSIVAENISPEALVNSVDYFFKKFDEIIERNNLEKIKTIGDAYMCAGGLPSKNTTNAEDALKAAREILEFVKATAQDPPDGIFPFEVRIGINTGPVIAGVVGTKKFQYDIWGNTVNIAARMESNSDVGKINVSQHTHDVLKDKGVFTYRGEIEVKNKKKLKMYYIDESSI